MVHAVADGDDLMEALDLNTEDLSQEKPESMYHHIPKKNQNQTKAAASEGEKVNSCHPGGYNTSKLILHNTKQTNKPTLFRQTSLYLRLS